MWPLLTSVIGMPSLGMPAVRGRALAAAGLPMRRRGSTDVARHPVFQEDFLATVFAPQLL